MKACSADCRSATGAASFLNEGQGETSRAANRIKLLVAVREK
jgi:hypothetical protein